MADAALSHEVRDVVGDEIPVAVAPTPDLDALLALMLETFPEPEEEASCLEGGRIPERAVARLFETARTLFAVRPWETATDDRLLRMDIPAPAWASLLREMENREQRAPGGAPFDFGELRRALRLE